MVITWLAALSDASAYPVHRRLFKEVYGASTSCQLCHAYEGNTERNVYGEAWRQRGETLDAFRVIEGVDSDRDGVNNLAEIEGGSNPGDPQSTPESPGCRRCRIDAPRTGHRTGKPALTGYIRR